MKLYMRGRCAVMCIVFLGFFVTCHLRADDAGIILFLRCVGIFETRDFF